MIYVKYRVSGHVEGKEIEPYFEEQFFKDSRDNYDYDYDSSFTAGATREYLLYEAVEVRPATDEEIEKEKQPEIIEREHNPRSLCDPSLRDLRKQRELQLQNVTNDFLNQKNPENFEKVFELDGKRYRMKISLEE